MELRYREAMPELFVISSCPKCGHKDQIACEIYGNKGWIFHKCLICGVLTKEEEEK
jgi:transcription elongation factor Elf1